MPPELFWVLAGLLAYLLGAIPFALLVGFAKGVDLRQHGSGNIGATNALRVLGKGIGVLTLLCDVGKGLLPVLAFPPLLALLDAPPPSWFPAVLAGLAVLGHVFPVYLRFRGGKGVATSAGAFGALHPAALGVALAVFLLAVGLTRYVSLGSILAAVALPLGAILIDGPELAFGSELARTLLFLLAGVLVVVRHRANLRRLLAGTESRFGASKPSPPDPLRVAEAPSASEGGEPGEA